MIISITPTISGPSVAGCLHFDGIHVSNSTIRDRVQLDGWIKGNLTGGIDVGRFGLTVDGAVQAPLRSRTPGSSSLKAGSTTSAGTLVADPGNISLVEVVGGTIAGSITATSGSIGQIICGSLQAHVTANTASNIGIGEITVSGNIGSSSNTVNLTAVGDIPVVSAANAWANINVTGASRQIKRIQTTGDFTGSISAHSMEYAAGSGDASGLLIGGTLDADVIVERYAAAPLHKIGSIPAGRTLWIGEGWYPGTSPNLRKMEIGTLAGQIILNGLNSIYEWQGPIEVDETTLSPTPNYANLSSSLGGGAVGLAPFQLHKEDCIPASGGSILGPFYGSEKAVLLRHYGPVYWSSGMPVTVEYQLPAWGTTWVDITEDFTASAGGDPRDIIVWAETLLDFDSTLNYRIRPVRSGTNALKCQDVTDNPAVANYTYELSTY